MKGSLPWLTRKPEALVLLSGRPGWGGLIFIPVKSLSDLSVKIYADAADVINVAHLSKNPLVSGFTTNPSLMRKAGVTNYEAFAKDLLILSKGKPISFEVLSDDFGEMRRQELKIASWDDNVFVKVPITNSEGISSLPLIGELCRAGVKVNVTAVLTSGQVLTLIDHLQPGVPSIISVFSGRIADTGMNPKRLMRIARRVLDPIDGSKLLWASVREVWNIFQADQCECDIVTVPPTILEKAIRMVGKDLNELSLDTVTQFEIDAREAGYTL